MQENEKGKILILQLYGKLFSILISNRRIFAIQTQNYDSSDNGASASIGNIYVGRVKNISENIGAAFVEIRKGEQAFFPLEEAKNAIIVNRKPDSTIRTGDELIVQLVKEPVKTKLAGVSAGLSLSGFYVVVKPVDSGRHGIIEVSNKLGKKYHHIYKNLEPLKEIAKHFDIIVRTNAAEAEDISLVTGEAENLSRQMEHILNVGNMRTCFSCLYQSEPEYITFIKNCYKSEYYEIVTDIKSIYDRILAEEIVEISKLKYYKDDMLPLYKLYSIETGIQELLNKKIWLKSGAYLVVEQTEALVAIDVNTGKCEVKRNKEEMYFKINMEAAEEIAFALRARNLAGIIMVDFINMKDKKHMEQLMEYMRCLLRKDSIPSQVVDITGLGLMEITRKKKNKSFAEQMRDYKKN